jgi:hypothetical protein
MLMALSEFSASLAGCLRSASKTVVGGPEFAAAVPNPTDFVLQGIGSRCLPLMAAGNIDSIHYSVLEGQLTTLSQVQGGCERIATTPVPFAYSLLLHRTAYIFCLTLPFVLASMLGWWTLLPVLLVSYTFFGLDARSHRHFGGLSVLTMCGSYKQHRQKQLCVAVAAPTQWRRLCFCNQAAGPRSTNYQRLAVGIAETLRDPLAVE